LAGPPQRANGATKRRTGEYSEIEAAAQAFTATTPIVIVIIAPSTDNQR